MVLSYLLPYFVAVLCCRTVLLYFVLVNLIDIFNLNVGLGRVKTCYNLKFKTKIKKI